MRITQFLLTALALTVLGACGGEAPGNGSGGGADPTAAHHHGEGPHGGTMVDASDHAAHFEIVHDLKGRQVDLYLYDGDMKPIAAAEAPVLNLKGEGGSASVKGQGAAEHWTFKHEGLGAEQEGRFRIRIGGKTYQAAFEHAHGPGGHTHDDAAHGPHDGVVAAFASSGAAGTGGWIELKLHDDLGDLELWLAKDEGITKPFDLPVGATLKVLFHDKDAREVILAVRNREKNEDEDGVANLRKTGTNYFIFPGETGADAKWLCGADFVARVTVSFEHAGVSYATKVFELRPHTHAAGDHGHDHDDHHGHDDDKDHGEDHEEHEGHDHDDK